MIAFLRGRLLGKSPSQVVIDCDGVGYGVTIPLTTYLKLGEEGDPVELHIHTHLSDSALALYGFSTADERELFLKLLGVSGIGPKLAMNILSGIEAGELREAVLAGDAARLALVPGIGKKTALRLAMELADKIEGKERVLAGRGSPLREDLVSALLNLGFRRKEVERVVDGTLRDLKPEAGFERLLRDCLSRLAKV